LLEQLQQQEHGPLRQAILRVVHWLYWAEVQLL
jgi:hypothetical protein